MIDLIFNAGGYIALFIASALGVFVALVIAMWVIIPIIDLIGNIKTSLRRAMLTPEEREKADEEASDHLKESMLRAIPARRQSIAIELSHLNWEDMEAELRQKYDFEKARLETELESCDRFLYIDEHPHIEWVSNRERFPRDEDEGHFQLWREEQ